MIANCSSALKIVPLRACISARCCPKKVCISCLISRWNFVQCVERSDAALAPPGPRSAMMLFDVEKRRKTGASERGKEKKPK